jgi:hypothetical protein
MRAHSRSIDWNWPVIAVSSTAASAPATLRLTRLGFFVATALSLAIGPVWAGAEPEATTVMTKAVTGQVVWIGKRAISVETGRTATESQEMLIPIDGTTKVDRLTSLSELKPGDTVRVECQQTYKQLEDGSESLAATVATKIALLRSATGTALRSTGEGSSQ